VFDSFQNQITGLGIRGRDKRLAAQATAPFQLTETEQAYLFDGDSLARKMVTKPVDAMVRNWVDFTNLDEDQTEACASYIETKHVRKALTELLVWGRVYGGAVLLLGINDGRMPDQPVNEGNIRSINYLTVIDRWRLQVDRSSYVRDPDSPRFNKPEYYTILPSSEDTAGDQKVHYTRLIDYTGPLTSRTIRDQRQGWGLSFYEIAHERLADVAASFGSVANIVQTFVQTVIRMRGLVEAVQRGEGDYLRQRVSQMDEARSVIQAILLDADNEEFETKSASVQGLPELVDRLMMLASEVSEIPVTILFGRSPAGLNATGESDMQQWHERISDEQETVLRPILERFFRIMFLDKEGPTKGVEPPDWGFRFRPLNRPDAKTQADTHLVQAQADQVYLLNGVVTPAEVRESRFGGDEFSTHTTLLQGVDIEAEFEAMRQAQSEETDFDQDQDADQPES
jgi:hypothetical protein